MALFNHYRALVLVALVGAAAHRWTSEAPAATSMSGRTMGTTWTVRLPRPGPAGLATSIAELFDGVDNRMSTYRPESELSRFNAHRSTVPFAVSPATITVMRAAIRISAATAGAFDVTVGPLVDMWGFGAQPADESGRAATVRESVGYRRLVVDERHNTLAKLHPNVRCDLSAIAKGYAVDRVAALLDASGVADYVVELGGEVRVRGRGEGGRPWRVRIETPNDAMDGTQAIVAIGDRALATSGSYRNYRSVDGRRVSHTIDPATGHPVTHRLALVSVIHDSCMMADALATALNVLGPSDGYALAVERGWSAYFVVAEPDGTFTARATPAFAPLLDERGAP